MKNLYGGKLIKWIREQANVTQAKFAEDLKVHYSTVSYWESERMIPRIDHVKGMLNFMKKHKINGHKELYYDRFIRRENGRKDE